MEFWARLEQLRARYDLLGHPFYLRWSAGELTRAELARYAGQYRHVVVALSRAAASSAEQARLHAPASAPLLERHAREEAEHVALWDGFAKAAGSDLRSAPLPETASCVHALAGRPGRPLVESLIAMYVIEAAQPAISKTKRAGLIDHYGLGDPAATAYFDVHAERDIEHAATGRAMIEQRLAVADTGRLLREAASVLRAGWELLDGVDRERAKRDHEVLASGL